MKDQTYNGWTNYETWRIALECFDGVAIEDFYSRDEYLNEVINPFMAEHADEPNDEAVSYFKVQMIRFWADYLECRPLGMLDEIECPTVRGWALSFVQECNFNEIAEHLCEESPTYKRAIVSLEAGGRELKS